MEGEDRLWHNREVAHGDRHGTKHDLDEAWGDALSVSENPLNRTIDRIACEQVLKCLTDRQREIVIAYYWGSCSQREIAHRLGISQPVLKKTLDAAIKKIKKFF
jgi:RNA polymerase sigma factor (sigma-70 family)